MTNWHPDSSRQINRRFIVEGKLILDTPAGFSNGETRGTELVILQDALEEKPLLPGASLAGAMRHYLLNREQGYRTQDVSTKSVKTLATQLFGEALEETSDRIESRVIVHDALGDGKLTRREGVKIGSSTRTADEGMLFSSQVWETGTTFTIRFELILYDGDDDNLIGAFAATLQALGRGEIAFGGRKNRGFGRVHVENWRVCFYDLFDPIALSAWLRDELYNDVTEDFFALADLLADKRHYVRLEAVLQICDSILIRAHSEFADYEHLNNDQDTILSGTSLAGALRNRALRIAGTANTAHAEFIVNDLFGYHGASGDTDRLTASRVIVEEQIIHGGEFRYIQNRVKIDRFTGGAFDTALFSERPLFANDGTFVHINLELRYPHNAQQHALLDAQTGLLLLILKDLWTEDLPLGGEAGVGRGRLLGNSASIYFKFEEQREPIVVELNQQGLLNQELLSNIQYYVDALWSYPEVQR